MGPLDRELVDALGRGDPEEVAALVAAGADIRFKDENGYDALLRAVHHRDVARDPQLLDLLRLLVAHGVDLNGVTPYKESGLRVLSRIGRFDAVSLLLEAGADRSLLGWTALIEAVALGSLADVERLLDAGVPLEETDGWTRTAWLVALLAGDLAKAKRLRERGANTDARGLCRQPPLMYAVAGHHPEVVRWLLEIGQHVDQTNEFGRTPLCDAVEDADLECASILIAAGADVDRDTPGGRVLGSAWTEDVIRLLLDAGADPRNLSQDGHRALCRLGAMDTRLPGISKDEFHRARRRTFGSANPERMRVPFWEAMIRAGISGYEAFVTFEPERPIQEPPVWCAMRFGQSITLLPDGRVVQIAGEHEDHYDPDFCIYNDVFVHDGRGSIEIYGYPEDVFPPTDFHTATLVGDAIYLIGSLGYRGTRRFGRTPVHRLDLETYRMTRLDATGDAPGWIYKHRALRVGLGEIRITGGTVVTANGADEVHSDNGDAFVLDLGRRLWRRER